MSRAGTMLLQVLCRAHTVLAHALLPWMAGRWAGGFPCFRNITLGQAVQAAHVQPKTTRVKATHLPAAGRQQRRRGGWRSVRRARHPSRAAVPPGPALAGAAGLLPPALHCQAPAAALGGCCSAAAAGAARWACCCHRGRTAARLPAPQTAAARAAPTARCVHPGRRPAAPASRGQSGGCHLRVQPGLAGPAACAACCQPPAVRCCHRCCWVWSGAWE